MYKTFEQCANDPASTVYHDYVDGEFRVLILRGPGSLCAYLGVKDNHPFYQMGYDAIHEKYGVQCHGGLTFADMGVDGTPWPAGYWWIGWDYGHYCDASFYGLKHHSINWEETQWDPDMVNGEIPEVLETIRRSMPDFSI